MPLSCAQIIGSAPASFASFDTAGLNTDNEIATSPSFAAPLPGRIIFLFVYFAGDGATVVARLVAWRTANLNPEVKSPQFTAPSGSASTGGQTLNTGCADGTAPVTGTDAAWWIGFWRAPSGSQVWSVASAGSFFFLTNTGADVGALSGSSSCASPFTCGSIEAYALICGGDMRTIQYAMPIVKAKAA